MFTTLVVALDLESDGDRALPIVQALAKASAANVELVTVSEPGMPTAPDEYELEGRALRYGWDRGSWTVVHDVDAAAGLVEHLVRRPNALLVMATTARRPLTSAVFGSVTRDVLQRCRGPVLLIGPNVPADDAPTSTTLVLGIDRDAIDERAVPAIVSWQSTFASNPPLLADVVGPLDDDRPARQRLDELAANLAAQHIHASTRVVIADDPITGLLDAAAELEGPVFVAISARYTDGRLHWHSATQRLVAHATSPVLVVPARPAPLPLPLIVEEHLPFHTRTSPALDMAPAVGDSPRSMTNPAAESGVSIARNPR